MANEDLPPSLREPGDVPPSLRSQDQKPPSLRGQESTAETFERDKSYKSGEEVPAEGKAFMGAEAAAGGFFLPELPGQIYRGAKALGQLPKTVEEAMKMFRSGGGMEEFPKPASAGDTEALSGEVVPRSSVPGNLKSGKEEWKPRTFEDIVKDYPGALHQDPKSIAASLSAANGETIAPEEIAAKQAMMKQDIVNKISEDAVKKVMPPDEYVGPEAEVIDHETQISLSPKVLGVPEALVDSSPKIKGTDMAPAMKPEVIPGTRSFSQDVWNRLVIPAAQAVSKQGRWGESLAQDLIAIRDIPNVRYGMEFGAPFEELYQKVGPYLEEHLREGIPGGMEDSPTEEMAGKFLDKMGHEMTDLLEGKSTDSDLPLNLKILRDQMVDAAKEGFKKVSDWAQVANDGEPIKIYRTDGKVVDWAPRENYFPRLIKTDILESIVREDKGKMGEMAKYLVDSRQAPNSKVALEQVKMFRKGLLDKKFGNIERSREMDLPGNFYERNAFKVIPQYMRTAYQRLSEIQTFGLNDHKALGKIMNIGYEGFDEDLALRTYRRTTGRDPVDAIAKGMFRALRNWSTASLIQFQTTLYHLPRTVYPAMEAGYMRAAKALVSSFGDASEIESRRMGVNVAKSMSEFLQEEYGGGRTMSGKAANATMKIEGIQALDRFDRKYSALLGKDWIENDLVKTLLKSPGNKNARTHLQEFGISPEKIIKAGKIDPLDLNVAAKRFSDRWQGNPDPTTLPLWATTHPYINMMFQFKNFMYVISRQMTASLAMAAKTGDVGTLARFATLPMAGAVVYGVRHEIGMHDTQYTKNPKMNIALNILRDTAPLPVGTEVLFKILQGKKGVQDLLIPPALQNVADMVGDVGESISKGTLTKSAKKDLARHVPLVGTALSHTIK